jgi:transposase-like protein
VTTKPSREQFAAAYMNSSLTVEEIALRFRVSDTTIKFWARRFNLPPRKTGGWRGNRPAPRIVLKKEDNHCDPVNDGPMPGDITPEQIAELAAYCRARHLLSMQTEEDLHCEHRQRGRCAKCSRKTMPRPAMEER